MNALSTINGFEDMEADGADSRNYEPMQRKQRRPEPRRKGHGGSSGGGMHCRRNKHTFGSGQSARLADLRAFAGAIALAFFAMVSSASAGNFTFKPVGNSGNPVNPATGLGSVATDFKISAYETTNSQYVDFLNNSAAGKTNQNGVFNTLQSSSALGGIIQSGSAGNFSYQVKEGFADRPVNFVNWFSAARFVNWYANGANANASSETGTYTLDGSSTSPVPVRNPGASYFLPSADEWTKAAFYNANTQQYATWPTASDSTPSGFPFDKTSSNAAAFGVAANQSGAVGLQTVGSFSNTVSTYGLWDMLGNVNELTDTSSIKAYGNQVAVGDGTEALRLGGGLLSGNGVATPIDNFNSLYNYTNADFVAGNAPLSGTLGFRVAAVPEPGNMVAAAMGIGGLLAVHFFKRRKLSLARVQAC